MFLLGVSRSFMVFILVLLLGSTNVLATALEAHLEKQSALLGKKKTSLELLHAQLSSCSESEEKARDRLEQALADVVDARVKLANVETQDDTQRELARRSLALAEQGLEGRQARLHRIEKKRIKVHRSITEHQAFIVRQQALLSSLRKQILRQAAQAQREEKFSALVPSVEDKSTPLAVTGELEVMTSAALAADIARSSAPLTYPELRSSLSKQQIAARAEMQRLNDLTKRVNIDKGEHYRAYKVVVNRKLNVDMEYWGEGQYYAEVPLSAGKHRLQIERRAFAVSVPEESANDTYVIIYDTSPLGDPRFVLFNQTLLDG